MQLTPLNRALTFPFLRVNIQDCPCGERLELRRAASGTLMGARPRACPAVLRMLGPDALLLSYRGLVLGFYCGLVDLMGLSSSGVILAK